MKSETRDSDRLTLVALLRNAARGFYALLTNWGLIGVN
jgi:hypothetical protein